MLSMVIVSCSKKSNPTAPVGIDFHITNPKTGDTLAWGTPVTIKWTLPANGSIDSVVVYRQPQGQEGYEALKRQTGNFRVLEPNAIFTLVCAAPIAFIVLRTMLGFTPPEWPMLRPSTPMWRCRRVQRARLTETSASIR